MQEFKFTDGSGKQNDWASKIASDWIAEYDREISNQKLRPETDGMAKYIEILESNRVKLEEGFGKIKAKELIDLFVAKRNPIKAMINQSIKQFKDQQS